jgi:hypothetical protein
MFQSRRLSQKIRGQSKKNVFGRTFPANLAQLFIILYCLVKITSSCNPEPERRIIKQTPPAQMTTIQKLYRTLAYVQLRSVAEFLTFTDDEYKAMETGLIEAINQLQRKETTTSATPTTPISTSTKSTRTNNEALDDILQPFGK